jgi:hypothetical protein|tara:strand:+ start:1463 stop:1801 length:339 start_codon:yes stop_codon:yes gene_type:complete
MEEDYVLKFTRKFRNKESFIRARGRIKDYFSKGFLPTSDSRPPESYIYVKPGVSFQTVANEMGMFISLSVREFENEVTDKSLRELEEIFAGFSDECMKREGVNDNNVILFRL